MMLVCICSLMVKNPEYWLRLQVVVQEHPLHNKKINYAESLLGNSTYNFKKEFKWQSDRLPFFYLLIKKVESVD